MSNLDDYLGRVRGLLISLADRMTQSECREVERLIDHGEPAEAMRALAWIIVEEHKRIPASAISTLRELTKGLIDDSHMPSDLEDYIED
jgi:hypothetical protein